MDVLTLKNNVYKIENWMRWQVIIKKKISDGVCQTTSARVSEKFTTGMRRVRSAREKTTR